VNLYSLLVYIEHNGDESPKELPFVIIRVNCDVALIVVVVL